MDKVENRHVTYAIDNDKRLTLTVYRYLAQERNHIDEIVEMFLKETGLQSLIHQLTYCIHELAANACRANTKRSYFDHKKLSITDSDSYDQGMQSFREESFQDIDRFHALAKESGLYIKFQIKKHEDSIDLCILNNVELTESEELRIREKFSAVEGYKNVADAFLVLSDSSEGAGLGIAMMVMMLREMGLNSDCLKIFRASKETHAVLSLPLTLVNLNS